MFTIGQVIVALFAIMFLYASIQEILESVEKRQQDRVDKIKKYMPFVSYKIS